MYFNNLINKNSSKRVLIIFVGRHMRCVISLYINSGFCWDFRGCLYPACMFSVLRVA